MGRAVAVGAVAALAATTIALVGTPAAEALTTGQQPRFERSIGGQGRPGVFAWGVQYNPVTQEVLVGDYLNFKIRRYDKQGNALGDFYRPDPLGQPYSIAVDPNDGAIYVAELKDNPLTAAIAKYDKFGNYMYVANASLSSSTGNRFQAFYPVWMTVEEDTGDIFVLDSHYQNLLVSPVGLAEENPPRMLKLHFNDVDQTVSELGAWNVTPPGTSATNQARIYGVDITDGDVLYMTDAWNRRAYTYTKDGTYLSTFAQTQTGGDNRGVAVSEATDRVYIVDAENSDVDVFRLDGSYVDSFSSEGNAPGQFAGGGRQIDLDDDGNVWVGDFGGFEAEKFTANGTPILRAPDPARRPPVGFFAQPRDAAIDDASGEVWVADSWGQRFQRFSSTGASMGAWGQRGPGGAFDMNYPRHIAIQPATATTPKRVWVVNERGHHLQVYNYPTSSTAAPTYVRQVGLIGSDDTDNGHFRWPGDVEFYTRPSGQQVAIITDRMAASVKVLDAATFAEIDMQPLVDDPDANFIPVTSNGTAVDPATGNIWIANGTRIRVYDQAGTLVTTYGASGTANGQFQDIADLTYCNGQMFISDERQAKISAFNLDGTFAARWGQTFGQASYDFKGPAGLDCDAQGRVYIADSGNDRIQVFNTNTLRTFETVAPSTPVVTSPAQSTVLPLNSVTLTGTAADNVSVGTVEVSVQNADTGLWWDSSDSSWEATKTYSLASYTANTAPATSVNWRFVFPGVARQGRYLAEVRTRDHNANASQPTVRSFAMTGATPPPLPPPTTADTVRPDGRLLFPAPLPQPAANLPLGLVHFTGDASDNLGVSSVRITLRRNTDNRYWNGSGTSATGGFSTTYTTWEATLGTPGGTATSWAWDWTPRIAGAYTISVEARDAAGNVDSSKPNVVFNVTTEAPDTVAPDTVISVPSEGASLPTGNVVMSGSASDDKSVASVRLAILNGSGQYWTGSVWSATSSTVNATVSGSGTPAATWSYTFTGGSAGGYTVSATAVDASNNTDASADTRNFTLAGAPDTSAPGTTVTSPSQINATLPLPSVTITGAVTDNVGVTQVRIGIQDTVSKLWWNGSGWGTFNNQNATVDTPGATSTTWSYTFTPPAAGRYGYQAFGLDGAGNVGVKTGFRTVTLQ